MAGVFETAIDSVDKAVYSLRLLSDALIGDRYRIMQEVADNKGLVILSRTEHDALLKRAQKSQETIDEEVLKEAKRKVDELNTSLTYQVNVNKLEAQLEIANLKVQHATEKAQAPTMPAQTAQQPSTVRDPEEDSSEEDDIE